MGRGFVNTFSNIFNSIKSAAAPALSFIKQNKNLIAKPILGAVGSLAATGISKGIPTLLSTIMNRGQQQQKELPTPILDEKSKEILSNILPRETPIDNFLRDIPTTNIIGD